MYQLELNEKEVKKIGELKWLDKKGGRLLWLLVAMVIIVLPIMMSLTTTSVNAYVALSPIFVVLIAFLVTIRDLDKAGKDYLATIQKSKQKKLRL